jgi:hypothetical protein
MLQNLEVLFMWSFPLMSLFFGVYSWRSKNFGAMVALLSIGLGLQLFSYDQNFLTLAEHRTGAVIFGRSLLLSFIVNMLLGFESASFKDKKERIMLKLMPLTGMSFYTVNKFLGLKIAEAIMAVGFLLILVLFWSQIRKFDSSKIVSLFIISGISFSSFMLTWSGYFQDKFFLNPVLWMIAFSYSFFILFSKKVEA